jgi:hypothetical protein
MLALWVNDLSWYLAGRPWASANLHYFIFGHISYQYFNNTWVSFATIFLL